MNLDYNRMQDMIEHNYTCIANYHLDTNDTVLLDNGIKPKRCRFCGKSEYETTFDSDAHAIPHLIGNRFLKSLYECDNCNTRLFSKLEEQFDAYMRFYHTLCHVSRNGNTVNSYKCNSKSKAGISVSEEWTDVYCCTGDDMSVLVNEKDKTITISGVRSYHPLSVYKAVLKMALTIMPESVINDFEETIKWLMAPPIVLSHLNMSIRLYEGLQDFNGVCMIYRRKNNHRDNVPSYLFGLNYNNLFIQIYIPLCKGDNSIKGPIQIPLIPCKMDADGDCYLHFMQDLSSDKKISKEKVSLMFDYNVFSWDKDTINNLKQCNSSFPIVIKN